MATTATAEAGNPAGTAARAAHAGARAAGRVSSRLTHAASGAVSSAWSGGADKGDEADVLGHEAAKAAARGANAGRHAVGRTAGATRKALNSARRREAYKAKLKAGRAARGGPTRVADARASDRIAKLKKAGKASLRIGKRIGGGAAKAAAGAARKGAGVADGIDSRLMQTDTDEASQLATGVRSLTFRASRAGASGISSSARFMWRHRHAPAKAVRAGARTARSAAGAARAAVAVIRAAVTRVATAAATISLPVVPLIAAVMAVVAVLTAVLSVFVSKEPETEGGDVQNVPAEYLADVKRAGSICQVVTPSIIAAQIDQESNWNPKAGSSAGAQGIAQFMPSTWASAGKDGDGDGKADIWNPHDAIWSQGNYMCGLASQVETAKKSGKLTGDTLQLTLAAYNAGIYAVMRYGSVPPYAETTKYVQRIVELSRTKYAASGGGNGDSGPTAGTLKPKLVMSDGYHVDIEKMGLHYTRFPDYDTYQCTWWAAMRRNQIGKPVDAHMGNGAQWNDTAARLGYKVSNNPKPGDVMCFEGGVLGSDGYYGHVAVVEQVNSDGSILISQSGTGWMAVVAQTISAAQLKANAAGVSFIH